LTVYGSGAFHVLAAIEDVDWDTRLVLHVCWHLRKLTDYIHTFYDLTKNNVFAI
jgi:hypothetical protein